MNNILILTSGPVKKLDSFIGLGVDLGTFSDVWYSTVGEDLMLKDVSLKNYKAIYFRMVGKSLEIATLVAEYAKQNNIKIIDSLYENSNLMPASLGKAIEIRKLIENNILIPKTVFGNLDFIDYPKVIKSTTSSRAREVWLVKNKEEMDILKKEKFKSGKNYFAQEYIPNANRIRSLVIGDRVVGAIKRHTKWNRDETKETLTPIPSEIAEISLKVAKAVNLDICGVDLLTNDSHKYWVIEANAAPSWKLINKHCGVVVENEIVKYIQTKI